MSTLLYLFAAITNKTKLLLPYKKELYVYNDGEENRNPIFVDHKILWDDERCTPSCDIFKEK